MILQRVFIAALLFSLASPAAGGEAEILAYVEGSTKKVCQLTGDFDRGRGVPTLSQTGRDYGVSATDLGSSFEHKGRLYFLFGDTWGRRGSRDVIAWTSSDQPDDIRLEFHRAEDGKWLPITVPGISLGGFEIPSYGVSIADGIYVVFTTDHSKEKTMGRSVLAVSADDGKTFKTLYELSDDKFINVALWNSGDWLYVFGSGDYRRSSVCLARVKPRDIARPAGLEYFVAVDAAGQSQWSPSEEGAIPLFHHDVVGELSVAFCDPVGRYVMPYNSTKPRGIMMRSAPMPSGPWSEGTVIFNPWRDQGYGHFMHSPGVQPEGAGPLHDPRRAFEPGGEYGPYLISRFTKRIADGCRLYYTMSTWNPYQVVLMQSDLRFELHDSIE